MMKLRSLLRPDAASNGLALALLLLVPLSARAASYGILLMAHGSVESWNQEVVRVASRVSRKAPVEIAFGMADADELQSAVEHLESKGVKKIVAVPLFVSSRSEVLDHTRFLLGLRKEPSEVFIQAMKHMPPHAMGAMHMSMTVSTTPIKRSVPVLMTSALDAHPLVVAILAEHAKALSRMPAKDTLIVVGHGPYDEASNQVWLATLDKIAAEIGKKEGFKAASGATLRDDNPPAIKDAAIAALRAKVQAASQAGGRAVIVPDLIAREGIESHIVAALSGLSYAWDGKTILPHPNVARWVAQQAEAAAGQ